MPYQETMDGIPVIRLFFLFPRLIYLKSGRWDLWLGGMAFFPLTLVKLLFLILRFQPDVINVHYLSSQSLFLWILRRVLHFRFIVSLHGGDVDGEPHKNRFNLWLFRTVLACADGITACSQALLDHVLILAPSIAHKSCVIHNGVEANLFATAPPYSHPHPYMFSAGKLERHKGFDVLISAFAHIAGMIPDVDLLIAGDGYEREALQAQVREAMLDARVQLLGRKSHEQVASLMRGARLIVIPSRRESFGIVGLEAVASGRPIIAARVGGLIEALENADVTWVESNHITDIATALTTFCRNADQYPSADLLTNQSKAQACSWKAVAEEYLSVFVSGTRKSKQ